MRYFRAYPMVNDLCGKKSLDIVVKAARNSTLRATQTLMSHKNYSGNSRHEREGLRQTSGHEPEYLTGGDYVRCSVAVSCKQSLWHIAFVRKP